MRLCRPILSLCCCIVPLTLSGCRRYGMPAYPDSYREYAYVADSTGDAVTVLDLVALQADRTLKVGTDPVALAVNPARDEVYIVSRRPGQLSGTLAVVNTVSNEVVASVPLGREPNAVVVEPSGRLAYVANPGSGSVSVVDLAARRVLATIPTVSPDGLAMAPDGRTLVVTSRAHGSVSLYSVSSTGRPLLRVSYDGCPGATDPTILPDSSKVFAACSSGHQVLAAGISQQPQSWADPALVRDRLIALLDVGRQPTSMTMKGDGGEIFVSNTGSDSVSEIATDTNEVGSTYPIGNRPSEGVVSRDGSALWVAATGSDALSLYSIDDGKLVSSLPGGSGPDALAFSADEHLLLAADSRSGDVAVIRTQTKLGPALLTYLPAGGDPTAIVVKAMPGKS